MPGFDWTAHPSTGPLFPHEMQSKKNAKMTVKKGKKQARVSLKQKARPAKEIENEKKPVTNKTMLIAQEVKFARLLANNDKKVRDKVLKNLKKWLTVRSRSSFPFTKADFERLWKGLFYCMWMSDKPLVQEELAKAISKIIHCLNSLDTALLYTKCTLKCLADEWFGIDRFRIDKFEMLVRKIIRETFEICKIQSWDKQWVVGMAKVIEDILLDPNCNLGFKLHITDVYMEELAKIGEEKIPKSMVTELIRPFVMYLVCVNDLRQNKHIVKNIFRYLIFQSDVGMDYSEKFNAWREAGFPCSSIDELQKVEVSDDEEEEKEEKEENQSEIKENPLDPRAGRVDVEIPQIPFDPAEIAALLKENKFHKSSTSKTRKHITRLINDFTKLSEGDMPFGIKKICIPDTIKIDPDEAAVELVNLNEELLLDSSKNYRKRKKNGDITEMDYDQNLIEESDSEANSIQNQKTPLIKKLNKKQKLSETETNEKSKHELQNLKAVKQNNQLNKKNKKKMRRLNVTEPLPKKKLMKSSKKLNDTVSESRDETVTNSAGNTSSKESASNKWDVDIAEPSAAKTPTKVLENKKSTKGKAIPEKEAETSLLKINIPWLTPVLTRLEEQNKTPTPKSISQQTPKTDSAKKRVKIVLQRNTVQNTSEYIRQIRQSPSIPYDANRKPKVGVLKPSSLPSPLNPFYKRKIF